MLRGEADLQQPVAKLMCLALGLLFLGRQDAVEATVEVSEGPKATAVPPSSDLRYNQSTG